jgi:hypothetical protein
LIRSWGFYLDAIHSSSSTEDDAEACRASPQQPPSQSGAADSAGPGDFGLLGSAGFSSGAFLTSPFAAAFASARGLASPQPDIQLTVFPTVSEPHMQMIADEKEEAENSRNKRSSQHSRKSSSRMPLDVSPKDMLVTVTLLDPVARWEVRLTPTNICDA